MAKRLAELKVGDRVKDSRYLGVGKVLAVTEQSILVRFGNDDSIYERDGDARYLKVQGK